MVQDRQDVPGHGGGGEGSRWAVGGADAAVVDSDDLELAGQPVGHRLPTPAPNPDPLDQDERPAVPPDVVGDAHRAVAGEPGRGHTGGRRPPPGDGACNRTAGLPEDRPEAADPEKRHRHTNSCRWLSSLAGTRKRPDPRATRGAGPLGPAVWAGVTMPARGGRRSAHPWSWKSGPRSPAPEPARAAPRCCAPCRCAGPPGGPAWAAGSWPRRS